MQGLIETLVETFPSKVNGPQVKLCPQKGENPGPVLNTFQRHTALKPQVPRCGNLFISTLEENVLSDLKRQIQNSAVG